MRKSIKLLSRLENKSGSRWLDFYEDNTYNKTVYYYSWHNGGGSLGSDKKKAAIRVIEIAREIKGLKLIDKELYEDK